MIEEWKTIEENLNYEISNLGGIRIMSKGLEALEELKVVEIDTCIESQDRFDSNIEIVERALKALEIIKNNFQLVDNCLHAKNPYGEDGWVFVKELEDEEEHNAWKEVLL